MANRARSTHGGARARASAVAGWPAGAGGRARSSSPSCSASTAPITATATAILAPVSSARKRRGHLEVAEDLRRREASRVRISLSRSGSTEASPSSVVTMIGKKQTSAMTTSLGSMPEAEPDHEQRRDDDDRDRLRRDQQRIDGAAEGRREVDRDRAAQRRRRPRRAMPSRTSRPVTSEVVPQQAAVVPQRRGDLVGRGEDRAGRARRAARTAPRSRAGPASSGARAARSCAPSRRDPQGGQRAFAQRDDVGVGAPARAWQRNLDLGHDAPGARREDDDAVAEHHRLLDVVGDEHDRARGSRASASSSQRCISARVIASSAANGSSRASTGLPDSSVRRNDDTLAHAARQLRGPGCVRTRRGRARRTADGPAARAASRDAPARPQRAGRRCRARSATASSRSRWGM